MTPYVFFAIIGYLSGSILFARIVPKQLRGVDVVRLSDDGNPGTANAIGIRRPRRWEHRAFPGSSAKGFVPVYLAAQRLDTAPDARVSARCWPRPFWGTRSPSIGGGKRRRQGDRRVLRRAFGDSAAERPRSGAGGAVFAVLPHHRRLSEFLSVDRDVPAFESHHAVLSARARA